MSNLIMVLEFKFDEYPKNLTQSIELHKLCRLKWIFLQDKNDPCRLNLF